VQYPTELGFSTTSQVYHSPDGRQREDGMSEADIYSTIDHDTNYDNNDGAQTDNAYSFTTASTAVGLAVPTRLLYSVFSSD
jgi:hypothetical protein